MNVKSPVKTALTLVILLFGITFLASAQNKTHTVQKGETLFSIAQQYNVNVQQLKQWNDLQNNELSVGQTLIVQKANPKNAKTHSVQPSETLFSISKEYNVSIAELKAWNNLSSNNLQVGQTLMIFPSQKNSQQQKHIVVNKKTQQNSYYTVKSGDSLYKIANAHGMTVNELKKLNDLSSNTIRVGQRLTVKSSQAPPSVASSAESSPQGKFIEYQVSGGSMNLQTLLNKFHMDESEFRALNPGIESSRFQNGQKLTVLAPPSKTYKNPYVVNTNMQDLGSTSVTKYSDSAKAETTTSGELYNPNALTAAHSNIALGTVIFIKNKQNQKGIFVRINDRNSGNGLKLSAAAWKALDFKSSMPTVNIYQNQ
ncbi:MAG TPA: LysM peptidoglycan-binding domain-containing protein [Balneolaceae bacterium]|nr:LysM peptidoglycan-binding domain-containing protein [Balneolaceae bacterium]